MNADRDAAPDDVAALKAALAVERANGLEIAAELAVARAKASKDSALIAQEKLRIAKLERQTYGQRSSRLIEQLALTFEELVLDATVLPLDVLEHTEQPVTFIDAISRAFPALRSLVITVRARQEL